MEWRYALKSASCRNDHGSHAVNKKTKKSVITKSVATSALDPNDHAALNRRAARFQREHEIERQKAVPFGSHLSSSQASRLNPVFQSRSGTPAYAGDEPEADPVRIDI